MIPTRVSSDLPVFRLALPSPPRHLDPWRTRGSELNYIAPQLYRGLLRLDETLRIQPGVASQCSQEAERVWVCVLRPGLKWSDGTPLLPAQVVAHFERIRKHGPVESLAQRLLEPVESVQVSELRIRFQLRSAAADFPQRLASPALALGSSQLTTGPYRVIHESDQELVLEPNPHFSPAAQAHIHYTFVPEDSLTVQLYEAGELDFVRRVPTTQVRRWKHRSDFFRVNMARFDYIGFGPTLADYPDWRAQLMGRVDDLGMQKLLESRGKVGCFVLPRALADSPICVPSVSPSKDPIPIPPGVRMEYSRLGGEDVDRQMKFLFQTWRPWLPASTTLFQRDHSDLAERIREERAQVFRKGHALNRLSCAAALEGFWKGVGGVDLDQALLAGWHHRLMVSTPGSEEHRNLCRAALSWLLGQHQVLPLGEIDFSVLVRENWEGWSLNALNELDLGDLRPRRASISQPPSVN